MILRAPSHNQENAGDAMSKQNRPIGIIDSGIGGFSVARRVRRQLPHENLLYFGDGGNNPYGNHTAGEILSLTRYMLDFMHQRKVKALLVACNTISCLINEYRREMDCPVLSVVQAGAESVAHLPQKRVGVISTCFTASTGCYPALIAQLSPEKQVFSRGYKNLAAMVEHGASQQAIDEELRENLDDLVHHDEVECCLLACTHYPLVEDHIHRLYPQLQLVDPADRMAQELERCLKENRQISRRSEPGTLEIYTTADPQDYIRAARRAGLEGVISAQSWPAMKLKKKEKDAE